MPPHPLTMPVAETEVSAKLVVFRFLVDLPFRAVRAPLPPPGGMAVEWFPSPYPCPVGAILPASTTRKFGRLPPSGKPLAPVILAPHIFPQIPAEISQVIT